MKFNFKKISAMASSALMVGMTMGVAAAASYPAPFVENGVANTAIVYGSNAASTDMAQATLIQTDILSEISTGTGDVTIEGDSAKLERSTDKFNYGDALNTHYTNLDHEDFSMVLAKGTYLNDDNNEYEYEQKIEMSGETITFFQDSKFNDDKPVIGFDFARNDLVLNYSLTFTTAAEGSTASETDEYPKLDNTNINFLGKDYFISDAEYTTNGIQLTLLDSANSMIVNEGETVTMQMGGNSYDVSVSAFSGDASSPQVKLIVNGETTNSLSEGQTYKLSDGTYVGIKDLTMRDVAGTIASAEFSLGSGKLVLEQGQEVELNDDAISTIEDENEYSSVIKAYFTNTTATNIDKMVLEWKVNTETFVAPGRDLVMPGFEAIKLTMPAWNAPNPETTVIEDDGDSVRISTKVKDGDLDLNILYTNSSVSGFAGIGESSTSKLVTNSTVDPTFNLNETDDSYFVATWLSGKESESYAYRINSISLESGKNKTTLRNLVSGASDIEFSGVGDVKDVGSLTFTLVAANDADGTATVKVTGTEAYGNLLATQEGMFMKLPVDSADAGDGNINISASGAANPTQYVMNITEEDKDGNLHTGSLTPKSFTATMAIVSGDGTEVSDTSLTELREEDDSDYYVAYVDSDHATKVRLYKPSSSSALNTLEIMYPESQSYADVYLAEASATSTTTGATAGAVLITDNEVATASSKNLIIVGGSCINSAAASVLGVSEQTCGAAFTEATNVGAGEFLIKGMSGTAITTKMALVVAGYDAADTANAVTYLMTQSVDTSKEYKGTSSTSAEMVVA